MRFIQDIYHQKAKQVFVFNNFYDEKIMVDCNEEIKEKTRDVVDMVYDLHVKNRSVFDFYGYRMEYMGKTYDIYINFGAKSMSSHAHERPVMLPLDIEHARKHNLYVI